MNTHLSKFIIINTVLTVLVLLAAACGMLSGFLKLGIQELLMIAFLIVYFCIGVCAAIRKNWLLCRHVANGLPMYALCFTGIGIVSSALGLTSLSPETLLKVFVNLALAISPNIIGVFLMVWLREIALWCGDEET